MRVLRSTAKMPNREVDKQRVENELGLPEFGDATTEFWAVRDWGYIPVALGYDRIVYGDHGPYVEFSPEHICWSSFPIFEERPEGCYFDECFTEDCVTMLYYQKRTVRNKPNPPQGDNSVCNNLKEGYANYVIGKLYLAAEAAALAVCCSRISARQRKRAGKKKNGLYDEETGKLKKPGLKARIVAALESALESGELAEAISKIAAEKAEEEERKAEVERKASEDKWNDGEWKDYDSSWQDGDWRSSGNDHSGEWCDAWTQSGDWGGKGKGWSDSTSWDSGWWESPDMNSAPRRPKWTVKKPTDEQEAQEAEEHEDKSPTKNVSSDERAANSPPKIDAEGCRRLLKAASLL